MVNFQLSNNLRALRTAAGLTQKQIADELNVCRQTYSSYETGTRSPANETLLRLSKYFNVTVDQLLKENLIPKESDQIRETANLDYLGSTKNAGLSKKGATPKFLNMSEKELELVRLSRDLSPDKLDSVFAYIRLLISETDKEKKQKKRKD